MSMPTDSGMKMRPRSMAGSATAANWADGQAFDHDVGDLRQLREPDDLRLRLELRHGGARLGLVAHRHRRQRQSRDGAGIDAACDRQTDRAEAGDRDFQGCHVISFQFSRASASR